MQCVWRIGVPSKGEGRDFGRRLRGGPLVAVFNLPRHNGPKPSRAGTPFWGNWLLSSHHVSPLFGAGALGRVVPPAGGQTQGRRHVESSVPASPRANIVGATNFVDIALAENR